MPMGPVSVDKPLKKLICLAALSAVAWLLASCARQEMRPMEEMGGGCDNYGWDMRTELKLANEAGDRVSVHRSSDSNADLVPIQKRLNVALLPTNTVRFVVDPERRGKKPEEFAGLVRFSVPRDGVYRVSTGSAVWVEVADSGGARIRSPKFEMQSQCDKVFKSAAFPLKANTAYWLQMSASRVPETYILITHQP